MSCEVSIKLFCLEQLLLRSMKGSHIFCLFLLNFAKFPSPSATHKKNKKKNSFKLLLRKWKRLSQESRIKSMASVTVGISCKGPPGERQGLWPYPSGPSQVSTQHLYIGHTLKNERSKALI
jgi:hypothetical protein